jgi:short-subunit dehydrogenase
MPHLFQGTTALVTGASRGIGAAFADELARRGANLILVGRQRDALEKVAEGVKQHGTRVELIVADLAEADSPARIEREAGVMGLTVDHLINNAGIGVHAAVVDVNVRAVTDLAARFLPGMIARRRGGILNVASTAGFQGLAWLPVYSGTKAYVITWSEAVWVSLRGTGVRCCCLSPGPVDTGFFDANDLTARPPGFLMQSAQTVARAGLRAYQRDRCHTISFLPFRLMAWSTRLAPRALAARLGAWYARRTEGQG